MRRLLGIAVMAGLLAAPAVASVKDDSYNDASGARVLREWIVVGAPVDAVWKAFTTDDAFSKWAVPVVHITPGNGGLIEFGLEPNSKIGDPGNVRNRIDVFLPDELLVFHNESVPAGGPFDPAIFATVRTLLRFEDAGSGTTRVTEMVVGFGTGALYDQLYDHLRGGNAEYLATLQSYFGKRP
ncbi:MAG: SRPBCC domain-containing protein [Rhizomicrobium sp.]